MNFSSLGSIENFERSLEVVDIKMILLYIACIFK
jgi:hypothetical protein